MKPPLPIVFLLGALAGSVVAWFLKPPVNISTGTQLNSNSLPAAARGVLGSRSNSMVPVKSPSDEFLQSAAVRDFGPDGPQISDFQELLFRQPSMQRTIAFANLLSQLSPEKARGVIALIGTNANTYDLHREHELVWERWAEIDGPAACTAIFDSNRRFDRTELSERTIRAWTMRDPQAAREWLMKQDDIPLREGMMRGVLDGFAAVDPAGTQRFISEEITDASLKTHGLWRIARSHLADGGLPAIQAFFFSFDKKDPQYQPLRVTTGDMFIDAGSTDALKWLGSLDDDGRRAMSEYVTSRLVHDKPDSLVRELAASDTPAEVDRPRLLARAVQGWVGSNPNAMGEWLKLNSSAPHYDEIVVPYAKQIRNLDPEAATAWAATIKDPELRAKAQETGRAR